MKKDSKQIRGVYERDRGSGIWWIRYTDAEGRKRREKVGRKSDAIDLLATRRTDVRRRVKLPENFRAKGISFDELAKDALDWSASHKADIRNDRSRMKYLIEAFGGRPAESITPQEIDAWLSDQEISDPTRNRYKTLLGMTYRQGNRNGKINVNPARLVAQRRESEGRIRWLKQEPGNDEEAKLRDAIMKLSPERIPEFDVALYTGLRQSVQMQLRPRHVDLRRNWIDIPAKLMKNREGLHVPLHDAAVRAFRKLMTSTPSEFICPDHPRSWFEAALKKSGVKDFTWHDIRHAFISRAVMSGIDLRTVQLLAGHKTIAMTVRYAHLAPDHLRSAMERLSEKFPGVPNKTRKHGQRSGSRTDTRTDTSTSLGKRSGR